ncbi:hypothetical protein [Rhodoblastus sp.]|uniref:hypothetical protein n=1 Tax=Rhodoblastus sp. TaxID=1962975 RepID=UPI002633185A|nr:hypothetical protein [Rhodoblastus sp.]
MAGQSLFKTALFAAALSGALLLDGCGRRGPPVPLDSSTEQKSGQSTSTDGKQQAEPRPKLPQGLDSFSLKAGASKAPTPFDFLL